MATISLCLIVKNEEENILPFLKHIVNFVDEIILVDTGSNDNTINIAKSFGCSIFNYELNDHGLSDARNFSLDKASKEWILVLDPDERITHHDLRLIHELIENTRDIGFYLTQRNYTNNNSGYVDWVSSVEDKYEESKIASGWTPNPILRLFKNDNRIRYKGFCHEVIDDNIETIGSVKELSIPIHHYGILNREKYGKANRNIELLKKDVINETRDKYFTYFQLAVTLIDKGDLKEAKMYLLKSLEFNPEYVPVLSRLACLYVLEEQIDEGEQLLLKAIRISPSPDAHNNLGVIFAKKKEYQKAIKQFEKAINLNPNNSDSYMNLCLIYQEIGKKNKAKIFFEKAKELNPSLK